MGHTDPGRGAHSRAGDGTVLCVEFLGQAGTCHVTLTFLSTKAMGRGSCGPTHS